MQIEFKTTAHEWPKILSKRHGRHPLANHAVLIVDDGGLQTPVWVLL